MYYEDLVWILLNLDEKTKTAGQAFTPL